MQYKFRNLGELAAYYEILAQHTEDKDPKALSPRQTQENILRQKAEAYAFRQCAHILRNTVIEP